jgi:hypothetical protein
LDMTDVYLVPATPDIQTLKNLRLTLDMFDLLEYPQDKRLVVLNQADPKVGLTQADVERAVRSPVATQLPSTRDVRISINKGVPLVRERPGHPFGKAIRGLVDTKLTKAIGVAQASVAGAAVPGPLVAVGATLGPALTPVAGDAGAPRVAAGESAKTRDMYIPAHLRRVSFFHRRR